MSLRNVFHFKLADDSIKNIIDSVYKDYADLIAVSKKAFSNKNTQRLVVKGNAMWDMSDKGQEKRTEFFDESMKNWLSDGGTKVMPLMDGLDIIEPGDKRQAARQSDARDTRNFIKIDMLKIKPLDISVLATAADKLIAAGVNSVNDNLEMLDRARIKESWADEHYITKNYSREADIIGEKNNSQKA